MERITTKKIEGSFFGEDVYGLYKDGFLGSEERYYGMLELMRNNQPLRFQMENAETKQLRFQMENAETKQKSEKERESREDGAEDQSAERENTMGKKDSWFGEDRVGQNSNGDARGDCSSKRKDEQFPRKDQMSSPKKKLRLAQFKPVEKDSDDDQSDESIDESFIPYHQRTESYESDWSE